MPLSGHECKHVQHQLGILNLPLCSSLTDLASDPRDRPTNRGLSHATLSAPTLR